MRARREPTQWVDTLGSIFWEAVLLAFLGGVDGLIWAGASESGLLNGAIWGAGVGAALGAVIGLVVGKIKTRMGSFSAAFVTGTLIVPLWLVVAVVGLLLIVVRSL